MITIYHNPRCSKSRDALKVLENSKSEFEIIKYLETPIDTKQLASIIKSLGLPPIDLIRKNESIWKENYKNKPFTDDELIQIMIKHPKLIERPIVIKNNKAVIARPATLIDTIL